MLKTDFNVAGLIAKYVVGNIGPQEQTELDQWKNESEHNKLLFDRLVHADTLRELHSKTGHHNSATAWNRFRRKQESQKRRFVLFRLGYAAMFLILFSAGYLYYVNQVSGGKEPKPEYVVSELIVPGSTKATLTLADGSFVALDQHSNYKIEEKKETDPPASEPELTVAPAFHKIETARGGEYAFYLSDGSFVRLNAMSAISFPIDFGNGPRVVELEGEAFFEVKPGSQPFIIKTKELQIEVMGTSFNISSYFDDAHCSATLVTGLIKVTASNNSDTIILSPSQQVLFDRHTGALSVREVDVLAYVAWNNGMFYFKDWTLESIMHYLSRWYDIDEVIYEDERLKTLVFGCKFCKYDNINLFLRAFEHTDKVKYQIQNKTIIFNY